MAALLPTYEYRGPEVLALFEGHVIARGDEFAKVASSAEEYLDGLSEKRKLDEREAARKTATHITTPNGAKGQLLSRVASIWGDEITVRFENGQIRRYATAAGDDALKYSVEDPEAPKNMREALQRQLDEDYSHSPAELAERSARLSDIRQTAARYAAAETDPVEQQELHKLVLAADAEGHEIKEAIDHLAAVDEEAFVHAPLAYSAVEQADLGRGAKDSWLDVTAHEMIAESENQDFDKLLAEGPTVLAGELEDGALADAGVTSEIALSHIISKTAGFQGEKIEAYREAFVAATEQARRQEQRYRQDTIRKEASVKEETESSLPDDSLFL